MKAKIILAIVWTSLSVCERQQRSTVLTDESKRVLEQFDFSNFDKQEGLNYIDRQRFENQIRGKRSQYKFKRYPNVTNHCNADIEIDLKEVKGALDEKNKPHKSDYKKLLLYGKMDKNKLPFPNTNTYNPSYFLESLAGIRTKRGHGIKKKHRRKSYANEYGKDGKRRRRKKKKKRKRYWGPWTEWTPCSVTCGRGRKIRWRKCISKNCTKGELEMGEKTCQLPACNLITKLLGL